jgi:pimeloyl-ACP methyl ester carboxylesterase
VILDPHTRMDMRRSSLATSVLAAQTMLLCVPLPAQQLDASAPSEKPVPGFRSVNIGERSLRYKCAGRGTPVVIIEPGAGTSLETVFSWNFSFGWQPIFSRIAGVTRICVYDRAGLGRSDPVPGPRNSLQIARDLHALLRKAGIRPPYILAGQSFGGMNARMFASMYPQLVAGLVLVDSSHPDQYPEFAKVLPARDPSESPVLTGLRDGPDLSGTREWIDFRANSELVRKTGPIGDKPLVVLTRSPAWSGDAFVPDEWGKLVEPVHQRLQAGLCALSTRCKHVIATRAGHNIQRDEPQLVIDAIIDVVAQARSIDQSTRSVGRKQAEQ